MCLQCMTIRPRSGTFRYWYNLRDLLISVRTYHTFYKTLEINALNCKFAFRGHHQPSLPVPHNSRV